MGKRVIVIAILNAAISRLLVEEFKSWNPWLVKKLVASSVKILPETQRERYREEWSGDVEEIPGELGKLSFAVGLVYAATNIRCDWREKSVALLQYAREHWAGIVLCYFIWLIVLNSWGRRARAWTGIVPESKKVPGIGQESYVHLFALIGLWLLYEAQQKQNRAIAS